MRPFAGLITSPLSPRYINAGGGIHSPYERAYLAARGQWPNTVVNLFGTTGVFPIGASGTGIKQGPTITGISPRTGVATAWYDDQAVLLAGDSNSLGYSVGSAQGATNAGNLFANDMTLTASFGNCVAPGGFVCCFPDAVTVVRYRAWGPQPSTAYLTAWTLAASNDFTTWTTLDTRSSQTFPSLTAAAGGGYSWASTDPLRQPENQPANTYTISSPGRYLYYRFAHTASSNIVYGKGGSSTYSGTLSAFRLYGYAG